MTWYLMDRCEPINGLQIKERYGHEFEKQKRVQNIPRFVIYSDLNFRAESYTLRGAKKYCRNHKKETS